MNTRKIAMLLFIIMISIMTVLMLIPSPPRIETGFSFMDKIEHFAAFFLLSFLLAIAAVKGRAGKFRGLLLTALSLFAYGLLIEFIQGFTGRSPEAGDLLADLLGITGGAGFALFFL